MTYTWYLIEKESLEEIQRKMHNIIDHFGMEFDDKKTKYSFKMCNSYQTEMDLLIDNWVDNLPVKYTTSHNCLLVPKEKLKVMLREIWDFKSNHDCEVGTILFLQDIGFNDYEIEELVDPNDYGVPEINKDDRINYEDLMEWTKHK